MPAITRPSPHSSVADGIDASIAPASAIDSELPRPPERTHLMLDFRASWVTAGQDTQDKLFPRYPDESIAAWHERLNLVS